MSVTVQTGELITPFGEDLAVPVSAWPVGMAGTIQGTVNPVKTQGGDTVDDQRDDPDPGPA